MFRAINLPAVAWDFHERMCKKEDVSLSTVGWSGRQLMRFQLGYRYLASVYWVLLVTLIAKVAFDLTGLQTLLLALSFGLIMWLTGYVPEKTMISYVEVGTTPHAVFWMDFYEAQFEKLAVLLEKMAERVECVCERLEKLVEG